MADGFFSGIISPTMVGRFAVPVNLVLIMLVAHSSAQLTWRLIAPAEPQATATLPDRPPRPGTEADFTTEVEHFAEIAGWHLFGKLELDKPKPKLTAKAPETRLALRLAGIVFSEGENTPPFALIAQAKRPEQLYRVGEAIADNVRIEQIEQDRVLLSRNGRLEALSLPRESSFDRGAGRAIELTGNGMGNNTAQSGARPRTIQAAAIANQFRDALNHQPERLHELGFASPYQKNGKTIGFHLRPGRNRQLFGQLGLRKGDILTQVNGVALDSPKQGLVLLQELLNSDRIEATVLRNGAEVPFTFLLTE